MFTASPTPLKTLDYLAKIHSLMSTSTKRLPYEKILVTLLEDFCLECLSLFPHQRETLLAKQILELFQPALVNITNPKEIVFQLAAYLNQLSVTTLRPNAKLSVLLKTFFNFFPEFIATLNEEWISHLGVTPFGVSIAKIFQLILKHMRKHPKSNKFNDIIIKYAHHIPPNLKHEYLDILLKADDEYPIDEILATLSDSDLLERLIAIANSCKSGINSRLLAVYVYLINRYLNPIIENNLPLVIDCAMTAFNANDLCSIKANIYGIALLGSIAKINKDSLPPLLKELNSFGYLQRCLFSTSWNNAYRKEVFLDSLLLDARLPVESYKELYYCDTNNETIELMTELYDEIPLEHRKRIYLFIQNAFHEYKIDEELVLKSLAAIYKKDPEIYNVNDLKNCDAARIWFACKNDNSSQFISQLLTMLESDYSFLGLALHNEIMAMLSLLTDEQKNLLGQLELTVFLSNDREHSRSIEKLAALLPDMTGALQAHIFNSLRSLAMQATTHKDFHLWVWSLGELFATFSDENFRTLNLAPFQPTECERLINLMQDLIDKGYAKLLSEEENFFADPYDVLSAKIVGFTATLKNLHILIPDAYHVRITEMLLHEFLSDNGLGRENLLTTLLMNFSYLTAAQRETLQASLFDLVAEERGRFVLRHYDRPLKKSQCFQMSYADKHVLRAFYLLTINDNESGNEDVLNAKGVNTIIDFLRHRHPNLVQHLMDYLNLHAFGEEYFLRYQTITLALHSKTFEKSLDYVAHIINDVVDASVQQILKMHIDHNDIVQMVMKYG